MEKLKEYLWNERRYNNAPKFLKYFEEWFENLTDLVCNKKVSQKPIIALVDFGDREVVYPYSSDGISSSSLPEFDLFFATEKKTGWVNIYNRAARGCGLIHESEEKAKLNADKDKAYIATVKIEWEE